MMIISVYILTFIIVLFASKRKFGKLINIASSFTLAWIVIAITSTFGIYDLRKPSDSIHILCIAFIITTDIIMLLFMKGKLLVSGEDTASTNKSHNIKSIDCAGARLIQIIALLLMSILLFKAIRILATTGSISAVRSSFYGEEYSGKYIFNFVCRQVPTGFMEGLIIYYTYIAFAFRSPKCLINAVFNVLVVTITSGGRYEIILFILILFMTFLISSKQIKSDSKEWIGKYKRIIGALLSGLVVLAIYITLKARNGGVLKGIVSYSSGSLSFLDLIFENPEKFGLNERLHGYMTFGALVEPIMLFLKFIGVTTAKTPSWYFNYHCQPFYNITTGANRLYFNNNTSILYFLFYDFGSLGAVIGGIWMGGLMSRFHNRMIRNSILSSLMYIYFGSILLLTPMYYKFFNCNAIFSLLALFVCAKKHKVILDRERNIND